MTKLFRAYEVDEDTPVQFVGMYVTKWQAEWGEPEIMFAEVNEPVYEAAKELLAECKELANLVDDIVEGAYTPDSFTTQPMRQAIVRAEGGAGKQNE